MKTESLAGNGPMPALPRNSRSRGGSQKGPERAEASDTDRLRVDPVEAAQARSNGASANRNDGPPPPESFEALRRTLVGKHTSLAPMLQDVAAFVSARADDVAFGTLESVARQVGVSAATIQRFASSLGFARFSALRNLIRRHLAEQNLGSSKSAGRAGPTAPRNDPFDRVSAEALLALEQVRQPHVPAILETAITLLGTAETIYLVAAKDTLFAAQHFEVAALCAGIAVRSANSMIVDWPEHLQFAHPGDVALVIRSTVADDDVQSRIDYLAQCSVRVVDFVPELLHQLRGRTEIGIGHLQPDLPGHCAATTLLLLMIEVTIDGIAAQKRKQI